MHLYGFINEALNFDVIVDNFGSPLETVLQ